MIIVIFTKNVGNIHIFENSEKDNGYITYRQTYIYIYIMQLRGEFL